jgi:tetratricopeptide (TPR) repeat protein
MTRDSLVFGLAGTFFGVIVGWMVGTQATPPAAPAAPAAAASAPAAPGASQSAAPFDAARATTLEQEARARPTDAAVRLQLGNLYFDAERYDQAITWYEAALKLDPKDVNLSTDLGVAYYYTNQTDRALAQLAHSLTLDPRHLKTLLNQGIVLAFGKQDLAGAQKSWEQVVAIAPDSEEGRRAKQGLDGLRSAHQDAGGAPAAAAQ